MSPVLLGLVPGIVTGLCSRYVLLQLRDERHRLIQEAISKQQRLESQWADLHPYKTNDEEVSFLSSSSSDQRARSLTNFYSPYQIKDTGITESAKEITFRCGHDKKDSFLSNKATCEEQKIAIREVYFQKRNLDLSSCDWKLFFRVARLVTFIVSGVFLAVRMAPAFVTADGGVHRAFRISAALSTAAELLIIPWGTLPLRKTSKAHAENVSNRDHTAQGPYYKNF